MSAEIDPIICRLTNLELVCKDVLSRRARKQDAILVNSAKIVLDLPLVQIVRHGGATEKRHADQQRCE